MCLRLCLLLAMKTLALILLVLVLFGGVLLGFVPRSYAQEPVAKTASSPLKPSSRVYLICTEDLHYVPAL